MKACIPFFNDDISWFEIIITTIFPAAIFFLGVWFNKLIEKQKDKTRYQKLEKYFLGLLNLLNQKNTHQIELLRIAANRQDSFSTRDIMAELASGESHLLLNEINRSELYSGFVLSKRNNVESRTKIFEKIISTLDFLYKLYLTFEDNNKQMPVTLDKYSQIWNNTQLELTKAINAFKLEANQRGIKNDQLLDEIDKHLTILEKEKKDKPYIENIELGYQIYIDPLRQSLYKFPKDSRAGVLMDLVQRSKYAYLMSKTEIDKNKKYFSDTADTLEKENKDLNDLIQQFKNV